MSWSEDSAVMLARNNNIAPRQCGTQHCSQAGWEEATDDGEPYQVAIFACRGCGRYSALGRDDILRQIAERRAINDPDSVEYLGPGFLE